MLDFKQCISFINLFISCFLREVKFLIQSSVLPFYWLDGKKKKEKETFTYLKIDYFNV